jgi:hypothetical protein
MTLQESAEKNDQSIRPVWELEMIYFPMIWEH